MAQPIPDEVCIAAIDIVLKPLGSQLRHYMPGQKAGAVKAMRGLLQAQRDHDADSIRDAVDALAQRAGGEGV